jgi:poly-gamma-glutamate biosynthesis protein PgsC/CapC
MIIEVFLLGLILGFIYYELTGFTAGGVIAPAYFALYLHSPLRILSTIVASIIVWIAVEQLSKYLLIFGRRRLMIAIILGFVVKLVLESITAQVNLTYLDLSVVGYIIPGLIANEMCRQKVIPTLTSVAIVTALVGLFGIILH